MTFDGKICCCSSCILNVDISLTFVSPALRPEMPFRIQITVIGLIGDGLSVGYLDSEGPG